MDADYIRDYIRDHKDLNLSLDNNQQFTDDLVDMMITMTFSEVTISHPVLVEADVPDSTLIFGVLSRLMLSESFKDLRDQVQYQDANNGVDLSAKETNYEHKALLMKQFFKEQLDGIAARKFLHGCWGVTGSNSRDMAYDIHRAGFHGNYRL